MNAWNIYWVMQLDSIRNGLSYICFCLVAGVIVLAMAAFIEENESAIKWFKRLFLTPLLLGLVISFIPSSKTVAAMVILPAIANNEAIKKEAGDLYGLAKQALTNLAKPEDESK